MIPGPHSGTYPDRQWQGVLWQATIHPYQIFLELYDIQHRRTQVATPRTNGFVESFNRTVLDEFFRRLQGKVLSLVEALQEDLESMAPLLQLREAPSGLSKHGKTTIETIEQVN